MSRASHSAWSRRRAAVKAETEAEAREVRANASAEIQADQAKKSDADILAELSLQEPEDMKVGDDFSAFLRDEVPARLQRRALRALWRSNPVLACVDELVDYGDDFKAEGIGIGAIKTAYRVGKGMLAHVEEMERQQAADPLISEDDPQADVMAQAPLAEADETEPAAPEDVVVPDLTDEEELPIVHKRRMRFEFDGVA